MKLLSLFTFILKVKLTSFPPKCFFQKNKLGFDGLFYHVPLMDLKKWNTAASNKTKSIVLRSDAVLWCVQVKNCVFDQK